MLFRPFDENDYPALQALDLEVLRAEDPSFDQLDPLERQSRLRTSEAALKFYERSEHSFVAQDNTQGHTGDDGQILGAIFAQSIWQGDRPCVWVSRLWVLDAGQAEQVGEGLLRACSKSAYDTAVYEVHMSLPQKYAGFAAAQEFRADGVYAVRYMGRRSSLKLGSDLGAGLGAG
jgi:hypothetical protein